VAKKVAKKKTPKKTAARSRANAAKKPTAKKKGPAKKKAAGKKAASKKPSAKKKATSRKTVSKKKVSPKKKAVTKKSTSSKATAKKATTKKATTKKSSSKTSSSKDTAKETKPTAGRGRRRSVIEVALTSDTDSDGYIIVNGRRVRRIATDPAKLTKKRKKSTASTDKKETKSRKPRKSRLSETDLAEFRDLLLRKRSQVLHAIDSLETESLRRNSGDTSHMPIHMADIGSDVFEQDLHLSISASERTLIREVDAALHRIADGLYGICEVSGKAIRKTRLRAKPWARMNIDSARERDKHHR
jgi:DnaK suppressor protein